MSSKKERRQRNCFVFSLNPIMICSARWCGWNFYVYFRVRTLDDDEQ